MTTPTLARETRTITIPAARLVDARARLARLARKAERFGQPAPTYTVGEVRLTTYRNEVGLETHVLVVDVTVTVATVGLSGWSLLAAVDLDPAGGPAIVRVAPGVTGDAAWHGLTDSCDHCGRVNVGRRSLVVLAHEDGRQAVVGRTCVRDYIGHDVAACLWPLTWTEALAEAEEEFTRLGGGEAAVWPLAEFLTVTEQVIEVNGWVARGVARERGVTATADLVVQFLVSLDPEVRAEILPAGYVLTGLSRVAAAIEWAAAQADADSDYLRNLAVVAGRGHVTRETAGLAASILTGYDRAQASEVERAAARAAATPVIEGRIVITGTVLRIRHTDTEFGVVTKMTVRDDRGFTVNGTLPRALESDWDYETGTAIPGAEVGARVEFTAAVTASGNDPTFGFYKRPTKATLLAPAGDADA